MSNNSVSSLPTSLKRKILEQSFTKDIIILRQVLYKEIQEWKRIHVQMMQNAGMKLEDLAGNPDFLMKLTDEDKKFIDKEIRWFLFGDIPEDLIKQKANKILEDLKSTPNPTLAQQNYQKMLQDELTLADQPNDIPFV